MLVRSKPSSNAITRFEVEVGAKISQLVHGLNTVAIVNDEGDKALVSSTIREGKHLIKQVSEARKAVTTPLQEEVKAWIEKEKALTSPIEKAIAKTDLLIQQFNARVKAQQQAMLERIAREEAAKLKAVQADHDTIRQESEFKRQLAQAQHSTDGVRQVWSFEVVNAEAVPKVYLCIDEQKIRAAVRAGVRDIPGIRIYQKQQTVYR